MMRIAVALLVVSALLCSCGPMEPQPVAAAAPKPGIDPANIRTADSARALLHTGDIVTRMGIGADSYLLQQMNNRDKTFSHCGVVVIENGYPFVYHAIGGEDNPDERLRRDSAAYFFSPFRNTGIGIIRYDFDSAQAGQLQNIVTAYYKMRPRFDMKFDLATDNELYCSEFVYKSLLSLTHDTALIPLSQYKSHRYVGIDDLYLNPHAHLICKVRYK